MPIFEYHCKDCQTDFELIRKFQDADHNLVCTNCQGEHIIRKISLFNASSAGPLITSSGGCSSCSGGSCSSCGHH